jgi:hypothetical protein
MPSYPRAARASSRICLSSGTPPRTALNGTKRAFVLSAITRASVVLPEPGGPQRIIDGTRSAAMALARSLP